MELEDLRVEVYRCFATAGRPAEIGALARRFDVTAEEVVDGLRALAGARHLVLDQHDRIVMAHPFAAVPIGFSVMGRSTLRWGGCAWDSFAIPHLLPDQSPVLVATRCPGCARPLAWDVGPEDPPTGEQVAHFLVPVARMWGSSSSAEARTYARLVATAPRSNRPQRLPPPLLEPRPESRHCWRHLDPTPGSEGEPAYLLCWAPTPGDLMGQRQWWAQVVLMRGPTDWTVEWVTAEQLSPDRHAPGNPPPGRR